MGNGSDDEPAGDVARFLRHGSTGSIETIRGLSQLREQDGKRPSGEVSGRTFRALAGRRDCLCSLHPCGAESRAAHGRGRQRHGASPVRWVDVASHEALADALLDRRPGAGRHDDDRRAHRAGTSTAVDQRSAAVAGPGRRERGHRDELPGSTAAADDPWITVPREAAMSWLAEADFSDSRIDRDRGESSCAAAAGTDRSPTVLSGTSVAVLGNRKKKGRRRGGRP
jgi:hypothetical protein